MVRALKPGLPRHSSYRKKDMSTETVTFSGVEVDADVAATLTTIRQSIDNLDAALVSLLAERFKCTQRVGKLKAEHDLPAADPAREAQQIQRLQRLAVDAELDPVFAEKLLNFIISEVVRHHNAVAGRAAE